ncbi:MAG TPA: cupin domain-containing protein [Nannocystis exedens]|nr:cupin domain-containing protein [Nannocystis exedens]
MRLSWLSTPDSPVDTDELTRIGVIHRRLEVDNYQPAIDQLMSARDYVSQDIIELEPTTPGLDELCEKFRGEHLHSDDEVRFVLSGEGIFDLRSADDRWLRVQVCAGDLLVVPAGLYHRFFLTDRRQIRCVRLFKDRGGWTPTYRDAG